MVALFLFELKYYFKNTMELINIIGLFFIVILLMPFGQFGAAFDYRALAPSILWIALTLAINLGAVTLFRRDAEAGRLEYYQLTSVPLEGLILAKWAAYYLFVTLPLLALLPLAGILMGIPPVQWLHVAVGIASGALAVSMVATLASVLMAGLEKMGAITSLIVLPLTIPLLIFGTSYLATPAEWLGNSLLFLWGFSAFFLPVLCFAGASCVRASN